MISLFLQFLHGGFLSNPKCLKWSNKNIFYDTDEENLKEHPRHVFVLCHSQNLSRQQFFVQNDAYGCGCLWSLIIRQQTRSALFALLETFSSCQIGTSSKYKYRYTSVKNKIFFLVLSMYGCIYGLAVILKYVLRIFGTVAFAKSAYVCN